MIQLLDHNSDEGNANLRTRSTEPDEIKLRKSIIEGPAMYSLLKDFIFNPPFTSVPPSSTTVGAFPSTYLDIF